MLRIDSSDALENGPFAERIESENGVQFCGSPIILETCQERTTQAFDLLASLKC